ADRRMSSSRSRLRPASNRKESARRAASSKPTPCGRVDHVVNVCLSFIRVPMLRGYRRSSSHVGSLDQAVIVQETPRGTRSPTAVPAAAAVELGFFREEGLDVALELIYPVDNCYRQLRDGAIDFVGGSAHSALAAFPEWNGAKLLCAQSQGMYWFLVVHRDLG